MAEPAPSLREQKAQLTRETILRAARRLFAEAGYARTSVRDIAAAAGVSAQTVYDSIGSKQALVARLNDVLDTEAGIAAIAEASLASDDPAVVVATNARITRAILEHCGDIVRALVSGAHAEPDLAAALEEGHRRHLTGARQVVERLGELGALPRGADPAALTETQAALADARFALLLQGSYGWDLDRIERWIADASRSLLLAPSR